MKHLKCFEGIDGNQKWIDFMNELDDFCQNNLAYFSEAFNIDISVSSTEGRYTLPEKVSQDRLVTLIIRIENKHLDWSKWSNIVKSKERFPKWENIKDYMIPFLHFLNRDYDISEFQVLVSKQPMTRGGRILVPPIEELLDDKFENYYISDFHIKIDNKELKSKKTKLQKIKSFFKRK